MKNECDIVEDLLFGYVDNTLKEGSKELVEKHLKTCQNCKEILEDIKKDENKGTENKEVEGLKKVNKKMKAREIILFIVSLILIAFIGFSIIVFSYYSSAGGGIQVFLNDDITEDEKESIKDAILLVDNVATISYESKEMALEKMKLNLGDDKELLEGYDGNLFPASFIIKTDLEKVDRIIEEVSKQEKVKKITTAKNMNPYIFFVTRLMNNEL